MRFKQQSRRIYWLATLHADDHLRPGILATEITHHLEVENERDMLNALRILFVFLFAGGCFPPARHVSGFDCSARIPFFHMSLRAQFEHFEGLDTEEKYALYLCGNQVIHPPALYLAESFARDAPQVVAFLTDRLSKASDDLIVRDIVALLREVQRQRRYDVAKDHALMTLLGDRIDRMKNEQRRLIVRQMLSDIIR